MPQTIGQLIYEERTRRKLSRQALADKAGVNASTIFRVEQGGRTTRPETLMAITRVLGIPKSRVEQTDPDRARTEPPPEDSPAARSLGSEPSLNIGLTHSLWNAPLLNLALSSKIEGIRFASCGEINQDIVMPCFIDPRPGFTLPQFGKLAAAGGKETSPVCPFTAKTLKRSIDSFQFLIASPQVIDENDDTVSIARITHSAFGNSLLVFFNEDKVENPIAEDLRVILKEAEPRPGEKKSPSAERLHAALKACSELKSENKGVALYYPTETYALDYAEPFRLHYPQIREADVDLSDYAQSFDAMKAEVDNGVIVLFLCWEPFISGALQAMKEPKTAGGKAVAVIEMDVVRLLLQLAPGIRPPAISHELIAIPENLKDRDPIVVFDRIEKFLLQLNRATNWSYGVGTQASLDLKTIAQYLDIEPGRCLRGMQSIEFDFSDRYNWDKKLIGYFEKNGEAGRSRLRTFSS